MINRIFDVRGMSCSACSSAVQRAVEKADGVHSVSVNLLTASMSVKFDEKKISDKEIIQIVINTGYDASLKTSSVRENTQKKLDNSARLIKIRLYISVIFLAVLMLVSMGHMVGINIFPPEQLILKGVIEFILLIPIVIINFKYFNSGFKALIKLNPNMDSLISISAAASILFSLWSLINGGAQHYYFESAAMILTFITIGKFFESKSKAKTTEAVNKLIDLSPKKSIILVDGKETEIDSQDIQVGNIVIVKGGMAFPADGKVVSGTGCADESAITGESMPAVKAEGDFVTGGTVLTNGYIQFIAERVGKDTTLEGIIKLVEEATVTKPKIARVADKISRIFVPAVIFTAVLTTVIWYLVSKDYELSLNFGISVLVISCPCALGLATPTAIMVGTGKAAEMGILIKSAEIFETGNNIKNVMFDKTGTITTGKHEVTKVFSEFEDEMKLIEICAAIENKSDHPLAQAIVSYSMLDVFPTVENFTNVIGKGVSGEVDGHHFFIGNIGFLEGFEISEYLNAKASTMLENGETILYVGENSRIIAVIGVADKIKDTAESAIELLNKNGINTVMITGDNKSTAESIMNKTGIKEAKAELLPSDKNEIIKKYQIAAPTAMVGDGINDSPALAAADVGIALGAGTDIAIESADVVLIKNDLRDVYKTLDICKRVMRNIKQNLFWALFYNALCIPLAAGVLYAPLGIKLSPMLGTIAMSLSSICVISNALRLKRIKYNKIINNYRKETKMKTVYIEGMACGHCEARVKSLLSAIDSNASVDFKSGTAVISSDADDAQIKNIVESAGYKVTKIN